MARNRLPRPGVSFGDLEDLRGTNTLRPADELVEAFYSDVLANEVDAGLLEDAVVLGQYCLGARAQNLTDIATETLASWRQALRDKISELLDASPAPNIEAHLLQSLNGQD